MILLVAIECLIYAPATIRLGAKYKHHIELQLLLWQQLDPIFYDDCKLWLGLAYELLFVNLYTGCLPIVAGVDTGSKSRQCLNLRFCYQQRWGHSIALLNFHLGRLRV